MNRREPQAATDARQPRRGHVRGLRYGLVTPARNEADNLRRLADCVSVQHRLPEAWIIVDDGSSDDTPDVAAELRSKHAWILLTTSPGVVTHPGELVYGRQTGRDVVAFTAGVEALDIAVDVIVKLDADVSFAPDFFKRLLGEFEIDPRLGIASGTCYEEEEGCWVPRRVARSHVRGATRAWRTECLAEIGPLIPRLGWDIVDEMAATARGWRTRPIADLPFYHHRAVGERDGQSRAWAEQGETAWYVGYRPSYAVLRSLYGARRDRAALAMIWGYLRAAVLRGPRHPDVAVRRELRARQRLRELPLRAQEVAGRSESAPESPRSEMPALRSPGR